jgi:hypothetical protein
VATADLVLVNSPGRRPASSRRAVPEEKVCVVPQSYEPEQVYVRPMPLDRAETDP